MMKPPWMDGQVRPDYAAGTWNYAIGLPAETHHGYVDAVHEAERAGWSPWWIRSRADVSAVLAGCRFDIEAATHVCDFFEEFLSFSQGRWAGQRFELADWQRYDLLMPLFGWLRSDGTRRFRKGSLWIPKKNGKSATCSGIGLYMLVADGEPGAEVYCAAGDRKQAGLVHDESSRMVRQSAVLSKHLDLIKSRKTIAYESANARFMALSADAGLQEGLNWSCVLFDELHVQLNRILWDTLVYGGATRRQPLMLSISTAGIYDPVSIGWEQWEYTRQVRDGGIDDWSYFALQYAAGEDDEWDAPSTWLKANPSLGITIPHEYIAEQAQEAAASPGKRNGFLRYHLNTWVQTADRWLSPQQWHACRADFDVDELEGRECWCGVDLSSTTDLTALALWFPPGDGCDKHRALVYYWLPGAEIIRLGHEAGAPYVDWARDGWLELTDGNVIDYQALRVKVHELGSRFRIREIAFDPYNATSIMNDLQADGVNLVQHRQGFLSMNAPLRELERLIGDGSFEHNGNPITDWMASGATVIYDSSGNIKLSRGARAARTHIDGLVALVMALSRVVAEGGQSQSVYLYRGIEVL